MKDIYRILIIATFLIPGISSFSQVPQGINYQAVVRDGQGAILPDQFVGFRISIIQLGNPVYIETHSGKTNSLGLITLSIGQGSPVVGVFANISWGNAACSIQVAFDPNGGSNYIAMESSQLLSVPYALYADKSASDDADTDPNNEIQDLGMDGNLLFITNKSNPFFIDFSRYLDNIDEQTLGLSGNELSISNGNSVNLPTETDPEYLAWDKSTGILITESQISDFGSYEPAFIKKSAFNMNFGHNTGTVAQGGDIRILNGQTAFGWGNHSTWTGSSNLITLGTITTGIWQGTAIGSGYIGNLPASKTTSGVFDNTRINWGSPEAIGSTTQAAGSFTSLGSTGNTTLGDASGDAVTVKGALKIESGNPGTSKILTSDASGNATWETQAGVVGGSGTTGSIPKFTAGTTLGNSIITESSDKIGIDDTSPEFKLTIDNDGGILAKGSFGNGTTLITSGAGIRLIWYPAKAAFRAGSVDGNQWDDGNIGYFSTAMGYNTTASSHSSTAMGLSTTASGSYSTAMGYNTTASANWSTAMGYNTTASGDFSTAMGNNTTANGSNSTAMGNYVSTNNHSGSFIFGDHHQSITNCDADNQMIMRFSGGYKLFTHATPIIGVSLLANGNSWSTISDSTRKENFSRADGEYFLNSLAKLKLGSWNYKGQDPASLRHYGPMAQEIFEYYGQDEYGTIGCDTLLTTADMDGIMMICLQALEERTSQLQDAHQRIAELENKYARLEEMEARLAALEEASEE